MFSLKIALRRIGFLEGWERNTLYFDEIDKYSKLDDVCCKVTIFCSFLVSILGPFYYKLMWNRRTTRISPGSRKTMIQIAIITFMPTFFCSLNTITFLIECLGILEFIHSDFQPLMVFIVLVEYFLALLHKYLLIFNTRVFTYYIFLFSSLLNYFIILLAVQRFVTVFFPEKLHFLVKPCCTRFYIALGWLISLFYKFIVFALLYGRMTTPRFADRIDRLYNRVLLVNFGFLALVSLIYLLLFCHLYRMPREDKWNRPEVALLYEGVPILLVNIFILIYTKIEILDPDAVEHFLNFEMRNSVISTAVVQFTYVFSFKSLLRFHDTLNSFDIVKRFQRASVSPVITP